MTVYDGFVDLAEEMLGEFGMDATLKRRSSSAYSPSTGSVTLTERDWPCRIVKREYPLRMVDGKTVLLHDKRVIIAPSVGAIPADGDHIVIGSETLTIVTVRAVSPAGTTVVYIAQARA